MTTIDPTAGAGTNNAAIASQAAVASEASEESRAALATDFDTFLTLLTAQMENQDPLNPTDNTEFVAQLAQFSSVEQQIQTNTTLTSILEAVSASGTGSLADWLGVEVRAPVPAPVNGEPVDVYPEAASFAPSNATLLVTDADGNIVAEQPFDPSQSAVSWNAQRTDGNPAPDGTYSFSVRYGAPDGRTEVAPASVYTAVQEARRENGEAMLLLAGGGTVASSSVSGVRRPG